MHNENWDDLRYVLAVADHGSVSSAARALGVNHATVLRRVAAFEERRGSAIFDKSPQGYRVRPGHEKVIAAAREAETAMLAVNRVVEGAQAPLSGTVRVTSTDTFCHAVLPPILARLRHEAPELKVELICSNAHLDLARLDADLTVRPAPELPEDLQGESPAELGFALYAAPGAEPAVLGLRGPIARARPSEWLQAQAADLACAGGADSFVTLCEMAAAGLGRAVLPCVLGDADPRLRRLPPPLDRFSIRIWVATHPDLASVPRIGAVSAFLMRSLAGQAGRLSGRLSG